MAFTIENNMPSAGLIRWTDLNIQYLGVNYAIANGNTNYVYAYWTPTSPNALVVTNTFPNLGPNDCLIFLNKLGIAVTVPNATVITGDLIVPGSVVSNALAAATITGDKIAAGTIAAANIAAGTITASQIAANAIGANAIAAGVITGDKLVVDAITAREIAANCITTNEIAANTINAGDIVAGTITATEIAANTITAAKIVAGTITATEIAANTITAAKIAANTITAAQIAAGTISATEIAAGTITAANISAAGITASKIIGGILTLGGTANGSGELKVYTTGTPRLTGAINCSGIFAESIDFHAAQNHFTSLYLTTGDDTLHLANQMADIYIEALGHKVNMGAMSAISVTGESHMTDGSAYADPKSGTSCAIKAVGHIATSGQVYSNGNLCPITTNNTYQLDEIAGSNYLLIKCGGTSYGATTFVSDISFKENITDTKETVLDKLMAIKIRQFDWIKSMGGNHQKLGVVSQELLEVDETFALEIPQDDEKPSLYQPDLTVLVPTLIKAIQELKIEIDELKKIKS